MEIKEYHAHLYFGEATLERAKKVVEKAKESGLFSVGRVHEKNVGPHPRWSCQLLFENSQLPVALPWIIGNRDGLTIFMHPQTGNDYEDHANHAIWMGERLDLNLDIFKK